MSESVHTNTSLWSKGMKAVIVAQFLSAFGDNALLFATLALLKAQFYPEWSQPILQMVFVGAYILFAPFVGQVADSFAKGRVMMFANGLKLLGAASICFGINPFLGYTLVGVGAAAYSPAKYGILGELTTGSKLVKANGLMEASTIAAILLGSVAGGVLADWHVLVALAACALAYGGAVVANIYIPKLAAARPGQSWNLINMTRSFLNACTSLWRNGETRFSLVGTSLFWGAGVTLRFLLVLWVPVALIGVGIVTRAGQLKERKMGIKAEEFNLKKGLVLAVMCGIFSAGMSFAMNAAKPMHEAAAALGVDPLYVALPSYVIIMGGGAIINLGFCFIRLAKVKDLSLKADFSLAKPLIIHNVLLSALGGLMWYLQFFFYAWGHARIPAQYDYISWMLHMSFYVLCGGIVGLVLKEWNNAGRRPVTVLSLGCVVIIVAANIVGIGMAN